METIGILRTMSREFDEENLKSKHDKFVGNACILAGIVAVIGGFSGLGLLPDS